MPNPLVAVAGIGAGSSLVGAKAQSKAASDASDAQVVSTQLSVDEQRRQFDAVIELMAPFVSAGTDATGAMADLVGINGANAQQASIEGISESPELAAAIQTGEEALLQNASATGGLRGGNTQAALAQFRPQMLAQQIGTQYQRLGGLSGIGQAAAGGQAAASQNFADSVSGLYQQQGAAIAGNALARGNAIQSGLGGIGQSFGQLLGGVQAPAGASAFGSWGF